MLEPRPDGQRVPVETLYYRTAEQPSVDEYSICVYIYDANAVYELGYSGFFSSSYSKEWLVFILKVIVGVYIFIYIIVSFIINTIIDIREYKKNKKEKH